MLRSCRITWEKNTEDAVNIFKSLGVNFLPKSSRPKPRRPLKNNEKCSQPDEPNTSHDISEEKLEKFNKQLFAIDILSDELFLYIFNFLNIETLSLCSIVSRRWYRISNDSSLWRKISLRNKTVSSENIVLILSKGVNEICLAKTTIQGFSQFDAFCCLEILDLTMANIDTAFLNTLLCASNISLRKLSLESLQIGQETIDSIAKYHTKLKSLNMSMCTIADGQHIVFSEVPVTVEELNIGWTKWIDVAHLVTKLPISLRRINLSGLSLTDENVEVLCSRCCYLIELEINDCYQITEQSLRTIRIKLSELEHLHINRCSHISSFDDLLFMKRLKALSLRDRLLPFNLEGVLINTKRYSTVARSITSF